MTVPKYKKVVCTTRVNGFTLMVDCNTESTGKKIIEAVIGMLLTASEPNSLADLGKSPQLGVGPLSLNKWSLYVDTPMHAIISGLPQTFAVPAVVVIGKPSGGNLKNPDASRLAQVLKYASTVLPEVFLEDAIYGEKCPHKLYTRVKETLVGDAVRFASLSGFNLNL